MLRSGRIGAMRDIELYWTLLGLAAPWTVAVVDVDLKRQRVVVRVEAGPGPYPCPECGTTGTRYDSKPRHWRWMSSSATIRLSAAPHSQIIHTHPALTPPSRSPQPRCSSKKATRSSGGAHALGAYHTGPPVRQRIPTDTGGKGVPSS